LRWREIAVSNKHLEGKSTRNILEAIFLLKGAHKLAVYVNHWPSQNNSPNARVDAARSLKLAVLWAKLRGIKNAIAMGDFNVVDGDFPHALKNELQEGLGQLVDVFDLFSDSKKSTLPMGSYFFSKRMQWNFLDRFFISKALTDTNNEIKINADSFAVLQGERNRGSYTYSQGLNSGTVINGVPKKFDKNSGTGAADHFPISIELEIK
jgi:endonuclease/exonuclease/phosphatase family metal-dependent hydrolase